MRYEYVCEPCKILYEKKHSMTENPVYKCKVCKKKLKKVISGGAGVIYRGDGWTHAGKKDEGYKRKTTLEGFRENPDSDPFKVYRNWNDEDL